MIFPSHDDPEPDDDDPEDYDDPNADLPLGFRWDDDDELDDGPEEEDGREPDPDPEFFANLTYEDRWRDWSDIREERMSLLYDSIRVELEKDRPDLCAKLRKYRELHKEEAKELREDLLEYERDDGDDDSPNAYDLEVTRLRNENDALRREIEGLESEVSSLSYEVSEAENIIIDTGVDYRLSCGCGYLRTTAFPPTANLVDPCWRHAHL